MKKKLSNECGRSMVEMLGVLAIIGILSVTGITGYKTAMTKHKANELLNEASKRAVIVAAKIAAGQPTNINEFDNTVGDITITLNSYTAGSPTFSFSLATPDAAVCEQMKATVGTDSKNPVVDCNTNTLTYNVDLGTSVTMTPSVPPAESNGCEECETAGKLCISDSSHSVYECVDKPMGCEACRPDQYCEYTAFNYFECDEAPSYGECKDKPSNETTITDGITTLYIGPAGVNWWTANEYCRKFHTRLATITDFGCSTESVDNMRTNGAYGCCKPDKGTDCRQMYGNTSLMPNLFVFVLNEKQKFWLNDSYNACFAYTVSHSESNIVNVYRSTSDTSGNKVALCR